MNFNKTLTFIAVFSLISSFSLAEDGSEIFVEEVAPNTTKVKTVPQKQPIRIKKTAQEKEIEKMVEKIQPIPPGPSALQPDFFEEEDPPQLESDPLPGVKGAEFSTIPQTRGQAAKRVRELEKRVRLNERWIRKLNKRTKRLERFQTIDVFDRFYLRGNFSLIFPQRSTFSGTFTDTGFGVHAAVGKYFEERHVIELGLDWDFYLALNFTYKWLFKIKQPELYVGPVFGIKQKIISGPLDNFISTPDIVKSRFVIVGVHFAFPIVGAVISADIHTVFAGQFSLMMMGGLQLFI